MKLLITATIICYNEEDNLNRCLSSLDFADEIIIVDSFSTDNTVAIAKQYTDNIYFRSFTSYGDQKICCIPCNSPLCAIY